MLARTLGRLAVMVAVAATASACTLYFDSSQSADDVAPPDSGPHPLPPDPSSTVMERCEDGALYRVSSTDYADEPGHGQGTVVGHCPGECRSAAVVCPGGACPTSMGTLCTAPPSTGKACQLDGSSCSGSSTIECPQSTTCGYSVPGATCACSGGTYDCTPRTDVAAVHAAMVGKWRGTVTPPSFSAPYTVSLWIYPDGTYWADCAAPSCTAFYYGGDGPHPWRKISVLSVSPTAGSWADVGVFKDFNIGAISALVVDSTHLSFTFNASWHNCGQPFYFNLTRE